jgi:transcriptional regulator with XRE-family HTH domain
LALTNPVNPVIQRRQLAAMLRDGRQRAQMTIERVAEHLLCSPAKISRMETGQRAASLRDVRDLCALYGVPDELRDQLMDLARQSRERAWWAEYELPTPYANYVALEAAATRFQIFRSSAVPGIVQTERYAYAVIASYFSPVDPMIVRRLTTTRMQRQERFYQRDPLPEVHVVLDEAVLHRAVGGPEIMSEQLTRILDATKLPEVTLQVIPFSAGGHAAVECTFIVLSFDDEPTPRVVYVEDVFGSMHMERPLDVEQSEQVFRRAAAVALSPEDSADLITVMRDRYAPEPPTPPAGGEPDP